MKKSGFLNAKFLSCIFLSGLSFLNLASQAEAQVDSNMNTNYLVLGVIASTKDRGGIALLKDMKSGRTFATKEGDSFSDKSIVSKVNRKTVEVIMNGVPYVIDVGGETATAMAKSNSPVASAFSDPNAPVPLSKDGNTIKVSEAYKDHLIKADLSKILMQAAAVPHVDNGKLKGFELWEIEANSIFEMAGFKNGDIVTKINGQNITDISMAIRMLNALKSAPQAKFNYTRNGEEKDIVIEVQ